MFIDLYTFLVYCVFLFIPIEFLFLLFTKKIKLNNKTKFIGNKIQKNLKTFVLKQKKKYLR